MTLTPEQLEAIRQRAEKATAGPWTHSLLSPYEGWYVMRNGFILAEMYADNELADAEFIANARTDIPQLLTEIARLRRQNHELFAELRQKDEIIADRDWSIGFAVDEVERVHRALEKTEVQLGEASEELAQLRRKYEE